MSQKYYQSIHHVNVNINLMLESVIQIQSEIMINVGASVRIKEEVFSVQKRLYLESC